MTDRELRKRRAAIAAIAPLAVPTRESSNQILISDSSKTVVSNVMVKPTSPMLS